jgi:hypothetical protein
MNVFTDGCNIELFWMAFDKKDIVMARVPCQSLLEPFTFLRKHYKTLAHL